MKTQGRKHRISGLALVALALVFAFAFALAGCGSEGDSGESSGSEGRAEIEKALNLANMSAEWTYDENADAWTMASVTAVTRPEIEDEQGVSVCVPGAYVKGIDTDGDGKADETSGTAQGSLVVDDSGKVTSSNGQVYTAKTAPVIVNTGAAGYSEQQNQNAQSTYAKEGYINVACGNRGKQSTVSGGDGEEVYTGDAPSCLVDQKNAVRFVKYNILLGNLPGSVDYFVSTGGSGGGAHAAMLAATSNNPDYYPYEAEAGAVGVYKDGDEYVTTVTIDGEEVELSDGMWGCMAYSAITSLQEADMAMAFEYYLNTDYDFNTSFQKKMAQYLSEEYMDYINEKKLTVDEKKAGLDVDGDGKVSGTVELSIEYDREKYAETNGYGGTYLNLYLAEFEQSLEDYLDRLDYAEDWTWFDADGKALSDEDAAAMSSEDKAKAFLEGRYAKGSTGSENQGPGGGAPGGRGENGGPEGDFGRGGNGGPGGQDGNGGPQGAPPDMNGGSSGSENGGPGGNTSGPQGGLPDTNGGQKAGTPDAGTTQSAGNGTDSANYESFEDMLKAYQEDIASIQEGDAYGNNIVDLYDPTNYIGEEDTEGPVWSRILMGASEGDISMMNSLNLQIAWLNSGTDAEIEWQWDGGHVPSEILGDSLALYVDEMYGKYVDGAVEVTKAKASPVTANGTAEEATGTDISGWAKLSDDGSATFSLSDAAAYRTAGAAKAIPGFDVIDYGQEDYVFGSSAADARHWDKYVLKVMEDNTDELKKLFNAGS